MTSCSRTFDGSILADVTYSYDALGRLAGKELGSSLSESYSYDLHGWTTDIEAGRGTDTLFSENIRYSSPQMPDAVPLYSGNISEIASLQYGGPVNTYSYSYDGTSRLTDARHFSGNSSVVSNTDTERSVSYDANGNIVSLTRYGASDADRSVLGFSYMGNRMIGAVDAVNQESFSFGYDADGNRTSDGRTGLEFSYNILNLPCEVHDGQQNMQMRYTYLSDGTKVSALDAAGKGLLYRGNFVYDKTGNTTNLESVAWDEGRIRNTEFLAQHDDELIEIGDTLAVIDPLPDLPLHPGLHATDDQLQPDSGELVDETAFEHAARFQDQWFVKDHLGNVRSVIDLSGLQNASTASLILEQNDYLPYGTKVVSGSQSGLSANRYRYAGKEEQRIGSFSSQLLDFGARSYDPWTCRWTAVDPLAHKYFGMSPYNYCGNDPVNFFDPDGKDWYMAEDSSIQWTDYKSQEEMAKNNIKGRYLGERVVIFNGSYDEKLGKGDNIYGEGAITATVDVYGSEGADDIGHYIGFTMTSNFEKFGAIADDEYDVTYNPSTGGKIPKLYAVNDRGAVDCVNGVNPSPEAYDPYSPTQKDQIYVHRTNINGWAGDNPKTCSCVSSGCLLIGAHDWDSFYNQIGKNGFKLILKRK